MSKKISLGAAITFSAVVCAVTFAVTWNVSSRTFNQVITDSSTVNPQTVEQYSKLQEIDAYVRENYLWDIDETELNDYMAKGYMAGINDKYAAYYDAEDTQQRTQELDGYLVGIGVTAQQDSDGYIKVVSVYENSPADAAGIQAGDLIVSVDGNDVKTTGYDPSMKALQGEAGTTVKLTYRRNGQNTAVELTRQKMEIPSVSYKMIGSNGYIRITTFKGSTVDQFKTAIDALTQQGAEGLIFDLRNNTGGTIDSVCQMLDILVPEGTLVTAVDRDGNETVMGTSDENELDLPMVAITNQNTASAAELFVADLRDFNKGKLVGVTTYGKGVMQMTHGLKDGTAINVTTAYFNPYKSDNFNEIGVVPDFEVKLSEDDQNLFATGALSEDIDAQLQKAIEVLETEK